MAATMRAVVLDAPGPHEALRIRERPVPEPPPGWVLIRVKAFGVNRSELHTRMGLARGVTFPRVLGIEATGVVAAAPGGEFEVGQQVAAMMGGMGRTFDGGYAEFTNVPATQVIAFSLRARLGDAGRDPRDAPDRPRLVDRWAGHTARADAADPRRHLVGRDGHRDPGQGPRPHGPFHNAPTDRVAALEAIGVAHVLLDDGDVAAQARAIVPDGVDAALELVGTNTLPDTLRATAVHGVVCFTGMLSNQWTVPDFYPIEYIPSGVRLTAYGGDAVDLPADVLQAYLDAIAAGSLTVPIHRTYALDEIPQAHADMEHGRATGKLVVLP